MLMSQRQLDFNPIMSGRIKYIEQNFGSGVSGFFYQWRLLVVINLATMLIW